MPYYLLPQLTPNLYGLEADKKPDNDLFMMKFLIRIFKSLRARSFKTNCSTWYLAPIQNPDTANKSTKLPEPLIFSVLEGDRKELLHDWLLTNQKLYPWVYFPDEISSSRLFGHWYPAIFNGETLIAWIKLSRKNVFIHDFETSVELPGNTAFIYDTFVDPDYRGQGLGHLLVEQTKPFLAAHGYTAIACHIEDRNNPSIKVFMKAGFKPIGKIRYLRLTFFSFLLKSLPL